MDDRTLRRLLKRESIARLLGRDSYRDVAIVDGSGEILYGNANHASAVTANIQSNGNLLGTVYGDRALDVAAALEAAADLSAENRSLASESLDKYRELTLIYNVSEKILAAPDIGQMSTLICEEARRFLRSDGVSVLILNEETGRLEIVQSRGQSCHTRSSIEPGNHLLGSVLRSGVGEILNDLAADPRPMGADNAFQSVIISPLKSRGRTFGLVVVGNESLRNYKAGDLQLLNALVSLTSAAIDVAHLYGTLKRSSAKPAELIYGLSDRPPAAALFVLGLQHVFIASIFLVVPILIAFEAGLSRSTATSLVSMSLVAMGIATLLQARQLGPVGSGYLAPQIASTVYLPPSILAAQTGGLSLVFGMTLFAGVFGLVLSQVIGRLRKLFPPEVCGVVVLMVGISIIRVALPRFLGIESGGTASNQSGLLVGISTLTVMIGVSITRYGRVRLYSAIFGLLVGYALAVMLGVIDKNALRGVMELPWAGIPTMPSFELSMSPVLIIPFMIATLASDIKLVGLLTSAQKTNDVDWKRPNMKSIRGGIIADSIGNVSSGLLGGAPTAVSGSNIGLAAATGATSRGIATVTGLMFIALAFIPKVTGAIALMPEPVMGAGLLFIACFLVVSGLELIVSRLLDVRRNFIVGLSILAGIGLELMPGVFEGAPVWASAFLGSSLAFATTLAVSLNLLLSLGVSKKAQLQMSAGQLERDTVLRFFDRWGAAWGARPDVIRRAGPAVVEWCEEVAQVCKDSDIGIQVSFDEFRLIVDVQSGADVFEGSGPELDRLIGHLQRRYDCQVRQVDRDGVPHIRFDFEH